LGFHDAVAICVPAEPEIEQQLERSFKLAAELILITEEKLKRGAFVCKLAEGFGGGIHGGSLRESGDPGILDGCGMRANALETEFGVGHLANEVNLGGCFGEIFLNQGFGDGVELGAVLAGQ
jgi:hypothetical protein